MRTIIILIKPMSSTETTPQVASESEKANSTTQKLTLTHRPRRLRRIETLRRMVRETKLGVEDLIYPLFVMTGEGKQEEVPSMPGCYRYTLDLLVKEVEEAYNLGLRAIALFPLIPDDQKDNAGTESYNADGLIPVRFVPSNKQFLI